MDVEFAKRFLRQHPGSLRMPRPGAPAAIPVLRNHGAGSRNPTATDRRPEFPDRIGRGCRGGDPQDRTVSQCTVAIASGQLFGRPPDRSTSERVLGAVPLYTPVRVPCRRGLSNAGFPCVNTVRRALGRHLAYWSRSDQDETLIPQYVDCKASCVSHPIRHAHRPNKREVATVVAQDRDCFKHRERDDETRWLVRPWRLPPWPYQAQKKRRRGKEPDDHREEPRYLAKAIHCRVSQRGTLVELHVVDRKPKTASYTLSQLLSTAIPSLNFMLVWRPGSVTTF
ncbi:uncharacterized protein LY79DRAFT_403308 [Colletotrichum navitas]|uniref:Uncharacterized protein n=1 Tax=Colletotrichum navitas TaxID=681940 RepID=A0AAD8V988_9PEZI|nr:uncharacterized protein LY79DRAFT_403308 [Colletotrichum navitas]KAK1597048.1 hypothetical protein LY79DRAFT_403308 [Colletotrichum navitas]